MSRPVTRATIAAVGLILLLAGMPLALALSTTTLELSLPSWPGGDAALTEQLSTWLGHSWNGLRLRLGLGGLLALPLLGVGWLSWTVLTYWTAIAVLGRLGSGAHHAYGHLSEIPPRRWVAGLVATALLVTGPTATATTTPSTTPVATAPRHPGPSADTAPPLTSGGHPDPPVSDEVRPIEESSPEFARHRVRHGDTLWDLAASYLDDPQRWRELFALNAHRRQPDGLMLADPDILLPGWYLRIPVDHPTPSQPPPTPEEAPQSEPHLEPPMPEPTPEPNLDTAPEAEPTSTGGLQLGPGVFLGFGLAAATGTALVASRYRRRHCSDIPPTPDLAAPPTVYQLRLAHHRLQQANDVEPESEPAPVPEEKPVPKPGVHESAPLAVNLPAPGQSPETLNAVEADNTSDPDTSQYTVSTPEPPPSTAAVPLSLSIFGPLTLTWTPNSEADGHDLTPALTPRHRELLTYLALHPDGAARDTLVTDLWHDAPPARPTNALNTTLSRLRAALARATDGAVTDLCELTDARMRLKPDLVDVDYWHFHTAEHTSRHAPEASERTAALHALVAEYHGELGTDIDAEWIQAPRHAAQRALVNAVSTLARHLVADEPQHTLDLLETAREADPYNENLYRDIMRLQDRLDMHDGITRTLALLETRLTEIGLEPEPETRELAASLQRRHSRTLAAEST